MSRYLIVQDIKRCIGCRACEVHCKTKNNLPEGSFYCKVIPVGPREARGVPATDFVFMACLHCERPWCVDACPTGAIKRRDRDGIVFVEPGLCAGCKACVTACPWGAPQWNAQTGTVGKCDLCMDRIDRGLEPACVTKCVTGCLCLATAPEVSEERRRRFAQALLNDRP